MQVYIVEIAEHLLPIADIEVSKRIERIFKQKGIKYYLNNGIEKLENKTVILKTGENITPDFILLATGREPICEPCDSGIILGDACGEIQLAHYAIHQAKEQVLGIKYNKTLTPSIIYGEPEIAWVGMREQECDNSFTIKKLPITALGKAWCDDATEGFIKVITKNKLIVGVHIVSKEASALIHTFLIAMQNKLNIQNIKEICFAHPTYSEGIFELLLSL